jgi:hypothetical protein
MLRRRRRHAVFMNTHPGRLLRERPGEIARQLGPLQLLLPSLGAMAAKLAAVDETNWSALPMNVMEQSHIHNVT